MTPCQHTFFPCSQPDYELCSKCGTFHSTKALIPEEIYSKDYWSEKWKHSTIDEQQYNVDVHTEFGVTKNQFTLNRIVSDKNAVLELGCAPGILLRRLREDVGFTRVVGVDTDAGYEADIRRIGSHDGELLFGYFPEVMVHADSWTFSCIIGLDLFEHVPKPVEFLSECHRLLTTNGQLFMMLPIVSPDEPMDARFFHPVEHIYIYSQRHVSELLQAAGFSDITFDRWTKGHETVSAIKP